MKRILFLALILNVWLTCNGMETQAGTIKKESMVSAKNFIEFMNHYIESQKYEDNERTIRAICYCLTFAIKLDNLEVFESALERWEKVPNTRFMVNGKSDYDLIEPLLFAASYGNCFFLEKIIKRTHGSIIDQTSSLHCHTALGYAACNGHHNAVRLLLAHNANPRVFDRKNKKIPLALAIENGKTLCVRELLTNGTRKSSPNMSVHDKSFGSLLHWALSLGNRNDSVRELITHGVFVNYISEDKQLAKQGTPLMVAVDFANIEGVEMLLAAKGIDLSIKNPATGKTSFEFAEQKANMEWDTNKKETRTKIVELLKKAEGCTPGV